MGIIKATKLVYEYLKYNEAGEAQEKNRAIDELSLEIEPGQFIAVLGHNGSGKSTFAKHINGLLVPTEAVGGFHGHIQRRRIVENPPESRHGLSES